MQGTVSLVTNYLKYRGSISSTTQWSAIRREGIDFLDTGDHSDNVHAVLYSSLTNHYQ